LLSRRPRGYPAFSAVEAHSSAVIDDCLVVRVVDDRRVHTIDRSVVVEVAAIPISTIVPGAVISEAVIDSAIEADIRPPIAGVPEICPVPPTPIAGSPEEPNLRRFHPCAGNPVIVSTIRIPSPITGCPNITIAGTHWLGVDRENRGRDCNGDAEDLRGRGARHGQHRDRK
jgi:hypothetical protein